MAFQVFEKFNLSQITAQILPKINFIETILKNQPTERKNVSQKMRHISFSTRVVTKPQKLPFLLYLWPLRRLHKYIIIVHFSSTIWTEQQNFVPQIEVD